MTLFFLPGARSTADPDGAYAELRADTERRVGCRMRATRIFALDARIDGADSQLRVGDSDPSTGETIRAIFATTAGYTVIWDGGHLDLTSRQIYQAIPFD